jgi:hypothetical protein
MRQAELDRAVARATQESVGVIRNMGFSLMVTPPVPVYRPQIRPRAAGVRNKTPQPGSSRRAG